MLKTLLASVVAVSASFALSAADFYLAPGGSNTNPGTREAPLASLEAVAASDRAFSPGDTLILLPGHHGSPVLRTRNSGTVTIRPEAGARVTIRRLSYNNATHWAVRGLEISPSLGGAYQRTTMVDFTGGSDNTLESSLLYSVPDAGAWSQADWDTLASSGISMTGTRHIARGNTLRNVNFGISVQPTGISCSAIDNTIENFSGDGIRGTGDFGLFEGNTITNCYKVNANHDDGFQSWSTGSGGPGTGVIRGVVVRGNTFVSWTDASQPFRGEIQGIGCFDGFFEDWVVENNVVITNAWHGIAFYGARNCRIVNNTVVDRDTATSGVPWIKITAHKDGTTSTGNVVRNNLTSDLRIDTGMATVDHNLKTTDYAGVFENWALLDLRLRPGSPAIDAGTAEWAPSIDIVRRSRPVDGNGDGITAWDLGAYEFAAATVPAAPSGAAVAAE